MEYGRCARCGYPVRECICFRIWRWKWILLILLFAACRPKESEYHTIIYTSEQACAAEEKKFMDSIERLSAAIDTLIAQRDRLPSEKRKVYDYAVKMLGSKIKDSTLSKYLLQYNVRRMGFDPNKVKDVPHIGR